MVQRFHHHGIGLCTALTISRHNHWEHYHLNHYCCYHLTITATTSIITNSAHSTTTTFPTTTAATTTTSSTAISAATATATTADFFREYRTGQLPFAVRAHRYCAPLCSRDSRGQLVWVFTRVHTIKCAWDARHARGCSGTHANSQTLHSRLHR